MSPHLSQCEGLQDYQYYPERDGCGDPLAGRWERRGKVPSDRTAQFSPSVKQLVLQAPWGASLR